LPGPEILDRQPGYVAGQILEAGCAGPLNIVLRLRVDRKRNFLNRLVALRRCNNQLFVRRRRYIADENCDAQAKKLQIDIVDPHGIPLGASDSRRIVPLYV